MPHLIIGHVTHTTARIWVRGDKKHRRCDVALSRPNTRRSVRLSPDKDFTATADFDGLDAGATYTVEARFAPSGLRVRGRLKTLNAPGANHLQNFSFILTSCNLSVVSITNFLALLAATAGTQLGMSSLDLPFWRWKGPQFRWLQALLRPLLRATLMAVAWVIQRFTGIKQPGTPYIRSPFLKLSAVFDSTVLAVIPEPPPKPRADGTDPPRAFLAVGDHVQSSWGATGVVVSTDSFDDQTFFDARREPEPKRRCEAFAAALLPRRVVLTQVDGKFERGDVLTRVVAAESGQAPRVLGQIAVAEPGREWFDRPSFFMHAGDQIYYDFPKPDRPPKRNEYRLAYKEAWFEDDALRHLLANWPHYMTLDDHEIADQFARDFRPPAADCTAAEYLAQSTAAYLEYAHALSPPREHPPTLRYGPYWYAFERGSVHFFVLDTRTQRRDDIRTEEEKEREEPPVGTMIDEPQMAAFLSWLEVHRDELKFVVTSVPFVAEINAAASDEKQDWFKDDPERADPAEARDPSEPRRNSEHDKWSADRFRGQRDRIIEFIASRQIEQLVFLTGDMHCCYHATMRIGPGPKKYESITVHELAGGPVNQLQLANAEEFNRQSARRTSYGGRNDNTDYEVVLERFHSSASAVMHVRVEYVQREQIAANGRRLTPEVVWNVIRTLTDPGPAAWLPAPVDPTLATLRAELAADRTVFAAAFKEADRLSEPRTEPVMAGRICFVSQHELQKLTTWDDAGAGAVL